MELERRTVLAGLAGLGLGVWPSCRLADREAPAARTGWLGRLPADRQAALSAAIERLLPGAVASGALIFIDYWLRRPPLDALQHQMDLGGLFLDRVAQRRFRRRFSALDGAEQDEVLAEFRAGTVHDKFDGRKFLERLLTLVLESFLGDPRYGGNRGEIGWRFIGWQACWWSPKHVGQLIRRRADLPY